MGSVHERFMFIQDKQIRTQLNSLSDANLHLIYIDVLELLQIPEPSIAINYYNREDKIAFLCSHLNNATKQGEILLDYLALALKEHSSWAVPKQLFEWIDSQNHRQCIFFWIFIQPILSEKKDYFGQPISRYATFGMPISPSNAKRCLELAIDFFNVWKVDHSIKIDAIFQARAAWERASKFKHKMLRKLENDSPELTTWFDDNSKKYLSFDLCQLLEISTFEEKLPLVLAKIDAWNVPDAQKTVSLDKAYSAMAGKKFRQKSADQKGANFWLGAEQVRMISLIAKNKKMSERDTLLSLISDAYIKTVK